MPSPRGLLQPVSHRSCAGLLAMDTQGGLAGFDIQVSEPEVSKPFPVSLVAGLGFPSVHDLAERPLQECILARLR